MAIPVFVISMNGKKLMPTKRYRHVRILLKEERAKIVGRNPFTIQLLYDTPEIVQELELGVDSGYVNVGVSLKTAKEELYSAEYQLLSDEKTHHDKCRMYRRTRRNRLWYREPRFDNRVSTKPKGWIPPSLQHKVDAQVNIITNICEVAPVTRVTVEVGVFDTALLNAMNTTGIPPKGIDYQHGPLYYEDNLRAAVFQRDKYTCKICKLSSLNKKNNLVLYMHHALFWKNRHANTLNECITVCTNCHTEANHQPGGLLWGLEPQVARLEGATYMNIVRWRLIDTLKDKLPNVQILVTIGAETSRIRKTLHLEKSLAQDAYCIGSFHPQKFSETIYFKKQRRNNRCLEKFYDAKYIDIRNNKEKKGSELGCNRTNRREARNSSKNLRIYRGQKIKSGRRSIRKVRYNIQPGDIIKYKGKKYISKGCQSMGKYVMVTSKSLPISKA